MRRNFAKHFEWYLLPIALIGILGCFESRALKAETAELHASGLLAVVADNEAWQEHHARYNGLAYLSMGREYENVFHRLYGGFNLENLFDQDQEPPATTPQNLNFLFEPRNIPMTLRRISDDTVELHEAPGPHWGIENWTRFTVREPDSIDIEFECVPRRRSAPGKFLGLFFANYVNSPDDGAYYFLGRTKPGGAVEWIRAYSKEHNDHSTFLPDHSPVKTEFQPGYGSWLWRHFSGSTYTHPFYYGIVKGQMLMLMFDHQENIRFAHSPTGGGGTPAWDFEFIIPNQVGKKYGFHARVLVKRFVSHEDVIREYERWSKRKVSPAPKD